MAAQMTLDLGAALPPQSFGENGRRAWFWQDGSWQVGRAYEIDQQGRIAGMCRDYGPWGTTYGGREPLQTHGWWKAHEVAFAKPAEQYQRPQEA